MEQAYQSMHSRKNHKFNKKYRAAADFLGCGAAMSGKPGQGVVIWKAPQWNVRVWPQTGTTEHRWCSKRQRRQNIIRIHEVFFFSFCVSLERHMTPLLILALTVKAHCQLRLKHVTTLNLLLSHCKTKINQRMLRLQAASARRYKKTEEWKTDKYRSAKEMFEHD